MAFPTKTAIVARAKELYVSDCYKNGCGELADINPTVQELRENGLLSVAKSELMFSESTKNAEWQGYNAQFEQKSQQKHGKIKTLIDDVSEFGDLLLIANKGIGKTNSLMVLAQRFAQLPDTKVIVFEDFPKFCNQFNRVPYMIIHDGDVVETAHTVDMENYFLRHERDYSVKRGSEIKEFLESNKDLIFTMEISDIERSAFFVYSVVKYFYRKHYLRAYKQVKKREKVVFIIEESQNVFDSSTISKKLFNRLRKIFSVARNLDLHFILCSQRLQDLNTKIRGRTRLLVGQVSLDDYELKIYRLLRHSAYRNDIPTLERGKFLYTANDAMIQFPKFKPNGKPYQWTQKPKTETEKPQETQYLAVKPKKKSRLRGILKVLKTLFWIDKGDLKKPTKRKFEPEEEDINEVEEESEFPAEEL